MKPKLLLRISSVLIFIHGIGHTFGHSGWKKGHDAIQQQVIDQMNGPKFSFMGSSHSFGEYFDGYGYACSLSMLLIGLILWIVSGDNSATARKVILTVSICLVLWATDELIWFFPAATAMTLLAAILSLIAFFKMRAQSMLPTKSE